MSKLALGTVQFGMNYGISNQKGQVSRSEIGNILDFCAANGIDILDTAQGYGESEKILGSFNLSSFKLVTKIIGNGRLETSLADLHVDTVYALMFHREDELTDETWARFESYKTRGLVSKIGVSVYSPERLQDLIETYPIDIVQFPVNILDQRFVSLLPVLKKKNIEIHTRSTFLQGLLLMDQYPPYFNPLRPILDALPRERLAHAIGFVSGLGTDKMVVGVTCLRELEEIYAASIAKIDKIDYSKFSVSDERFINPSLWKVQK